ncbi:MAG TPA: M23 family metallopeptidase [Methylomirabilota bacterium]|nr:M23 family metallopeptidase [Methylomirabilota bacterium]
MIDPRSTRARCIAVAALVLLAAGVHAADPKKPAETKKGADPKQAPTPGARTHTVVSGDTLSGIAKRYGVNVPALVTANSLPNDRVTLRLGQKLTVPAGTAAKAAPTKSSGVKPTVTARSSQALAAVPPSTRGTRAESTVREPRGCCGPRACCGPRNLMLFVPDFVEASPPFAWPVEGPVTSTFGRRRAGWHRGIDIKAERGAVVFAAAAGVVLTSDREPRYGRVVKIEHEGGFLTVYAHNEENLVEPGSRVATGDPIATIGRTGRATAHHLHFEIRRDGSVYNPLYLLPLPPRIGQVEESEETEEEHD